MTKRMTAEEVLSDLQDELHHATEWFKASGQPFDQGLASGFAKAADVVRDNLIPQWQDEPDEDGWHHLKGRDDKRPLYVRKFNDGWYVSTPRDRGGEYYQWEKLRCQVCPIGARPQ